MDEADDRRYRWIDARKLTPDQHMLVNFAHCHEEWQDNVDEARRDEVKERVTQAAEKGLISSAVAGLLLERLAAAEDPTELEGDLSTAGIPEIYVPRDSD